MIAVALKGLAGRKVRALLTALAVVIGVTMVSGTLVLTDTIQKGFDGVFGASYEQTDAVIAGKEIVKGSQSGAATVPESLLAQVRALPEVEAAGGTIAPIASNRGRDLRPRRQGRRLRRRTPVRTRQRRVAAAVQPAQAQDRPVARGAEAGRPRRRHGGRAELQGRRHGHRGHARSQAPLRGDRHRHLRRARLARRRHDRDLGPAHRPDAAGQAKAASTASRSPPRTAPRRPSSSAPSSRWSPPAWRSRTPSSRRRPTPRTPTSSSTPSATSCWASARSRCSWARS